MPMRRDEESLLNHSTDNKNDVALFSPFTGPIVPLAEVPDPCSPRACSATESASIRWITCSSPRAMAPSRTWRARSRRHAAFAAGRGDFGV